MLYPGHCLSPCEIEMLSRVCRTVCAENGLPLTSSGAEKTASHLLKLFMNGLTGEEELVDAARNRMKWLPRAHALQKTAALQHLPADGPRDISSQVA
jgi:hypothetical protein